jgi:hypothetical protein
MPVIEEKVDAVFLGRDRILGRLVDDLQIGDAELVAKGRAVVLRTTPVTIERRFLRQMIGARELILRHVLLEHHALQRAGAVAHLEEVQLAARALVVEPALEGDGLPIMAADVLDVDHGLMEVGISAAAHRMNTDGHRWPPTPVPSSSKTTKKHEERPEPRSESGGGASCSLGRGRAGICVHRWFRETLDSFRDQHTERSVWPRRHGPHAWKTGGGT